MQVTAQHHTAFQRRLVSQLAECQTIFLVSNIVEQRRWKNQKERKTLYSQKILNI